MEDSPDFLNEYLDYIGLSECPTTYHRWTAISFLGTYLGRQIHLNLGHTKIHPNTYMMLIGVAGARKSTAIKIGKRIITLAGYEYISADKSSKEKFMLDLEGLEEETTDNILDRNIFGDRDSKDNYREMYVAADEFNDFVGNGNVEFISLLGTMWDFEGVFKNRIKTGRSVEISNPTINILGGNTQVSFARAFPTDMLGQGFFSRLLLIHGEPTGRRITFPEPPTEVDTARIVRELQQIKLRAVGQVSMNRSARSLLDKIYTSQSYEVKDSRFDSYNNRRFTHLLKICMICAAAQRTTELTEKIVIYANTILSHAEHMMPKALGEFGKSRHSDVANKIMYILEQTGSPLTLQQIYARVSTDMEKVEDAIVILRGLTTAGKIFNAGGGFLAKRRVIKEDTSGTVDYSMLTAEERELVS